MTLKSKFLPWQPKLVFSGHSYYAIDAVYGTIAGQRDVWDAIQDNSSPSVRLEQSICTSLAACYFLFPSTTIQHCAAHMSDHL